MDVACHTARGHLYIANAVSVFNIYLLLQRPRYVLAVIGPSGWWKAKAGST